MVFMGTPPLAAVALKAIVEAGHEVAAVYTKPRKPVGRKQIITKTPVANIADELGLPCFEPTTLRDEKEIERLKALSPEMIVVVAYGKILTREVFDMPKHGAINLHVSLLPKYRGAAPIQRAIMAGERESGASIMRIDEGVDTGDVIAEVRFSIDENDTAGDIFDKTEEFGVPLLIKTINEIKNGNAVYTPQQHELSSPALPIEKSELACNFEMEAEQIHNLTRGVAPFMMTTLILCDAVCGIQETLVSKAGGAPGTVLCLKPLTIACKKDAIVIQKLKPQGKNLMDAVSFAVGRRLKVGDKVD